MFKKCIIGLVCMQQGEMLMHVFGMHGKELYGKQLSSYKLQVWLILLVIINSVIAYVQDPYSHP